MDTMDREFIFEMFRSVSKMAGEIIPPPVCVRCESYSKGQCSTWNAEIPVEALRKGCEMFEEFIPF